MLGPTAEGGVPDNGAMTENGYFCRLLSPFYRECGSAGHEFWNLGLNSAFAAEELVIFIWLLNHLCLSFLVCKTEVIIVLPFGL